MKVIQLPPVEFLNEYFDTKEEAIAYNTAIRSASGAFTERHGHDTNDY